NNELNEEEYRYKKDSLANQPLGRRVLRDKVKFTFGYFMNINNEMNAKYNNSVLNYDLTSGGQEIVRDTVLYITNHRTKLALPLEQGFGLGFKKGEKINLVADFALTNWQNFKTFNEVNNFKN